MNKNQIIALIAVTGTAIALYLASIPRTYEDCILANMSKARSERAASIVSMICIARHPDSYKDFNDRFKAARK